MEIKELLSHGKFTKAAETVIKISEEKLKYKNDSIKNIRCQFRNFVSKIVEETRDPKFECETFEFITSLNCLLDWANKFLN